MRRALAAAVTIPRAAAAAAVGTLVLNGKISEANAAELVDQVADKPLLVILDVTGQGGPAA